jgi:putative endopeptidase
MPSPRADGFAEINVNEPSYFGARLAARRGAPRGLEGVAAAAHRARVGGVPVVGARVDANFAFYGTELTGVPVNRERWKRGVSFVEAAMGEASGKVYVERHFPPRPKRRWTSSSRTSSRPTGVDRDPRVDDPETRGAPSRSSTRSRRRSAPRDVEGLLALEVGPAI